MREIMVASTRRPCSPQRLTCGTRSMCSSRRRGMPRDTSSTSATASGRTPIRRPLRAWSITCMNDPEDLSGSAVAFYPLNAWLIAAMGWREALAAFGCIVVVATVSLALLYREPPAAAGAVGGASGPERENGPPGRQRRQGIGGARRSRGRVAPPSAPSRLLCPPLSLTLASLASWRFI